MFPKIVGFPPKSSILIGFSIIFTIHLGYPYFWKHPYIVQHSTASEPQVLEFSLCKKKNIDISGPRWPSIPVCRMVFQFGSESFTIEKCLEITKHPSIHPSIHLQTQKLTRQWKNHGFLVANNIFIACCLSIKSCYFSGLALNSTVFLLTKNFQNFQAIHKLRPRTRTFSPPRPSPGLFHDLGKALTASKAYFVSIWTAISLLAANFNFFPEKLANEKSGRCHPLLGGLSSLKFLQQITWW